MWAKLDSGERRSDAVNQREPQGSGRTWPELRSGIDRTNRPKIVSCQVPLESPFQKFCHVAADFGEFSKYYFVNEFGMRAGLLADRIGSILLVRQYRLLIDGVSWEIPGGGVNDGETPSQAAVRECAEEMGVRCANPKPLLFYHTGLDIVFSPAHLFYSTEISAESTQWRGNAREVSACEWIPFPDCLDMVFRGGIVDVFSVCALLAYRAIKRRQSVPGAPGQE